MIRGVRLGVLAIGWVAVAPLLTAQVVSRVGGVVLHPVPPDAVPIPQIRVVLHRVGRATQGPIDSMISDGRGRFHFRFQVDSTSSYLLSARYAGIEYFSSLVPTNPVRADTAMRLLVYDTATVATVRVKGRTLVVSAPDAIGARTVIDWWVLDNPGTVTKVGRDSLAATWAGPLPIGARNPQVGDLRLSQISPEAVQFATDSVFVSAPLSPGEKELVLQYELPGNRRRVSVPVAGIDSVDLFAEERSLTIEGPGWRSRDTQRFEGRLFRRFQRVDRAASLVLRLPGGEVPTWALPMLVSGAAVILAVGTWLRLRERTLAAPRVAT